jgi:hypothetical protein
MHDPSSSWRVEKVHRPVEFPCSLVRWNRPDQFPDLPDDDTLLTISVQALVVGS